MPVRFHRSFRVLPGVRVNLGKTGASVSIGTRGLHETIGRKGVRTTVGLPGSDLSYTQLSAHRRGVPASLTGLAIKVAAGLVLLALIFRYG